MTAIPARVAGVPDVIAVCPKPDADRHVCGARGRRVAALPARRRARDRGAGLRHRHECRASTGSSDQAMPTSPRPRRSSSPDCAIDFFAGPSEIAVLSTSGRPAWIAADLIAQAEHDPDARAILITTRLAPGAGRRARSAAADAGRRARAAGAGGARRHHRDAQRSTRPSSSCSGWRPSTPCATRTPSPRGSRAPARCSSATTARRPPATTSRARTTCSRPAAPRAARGGLSTADFVRVLDGPDAHRGRTAPDRAGGHRARATPKACAPTPSRCASGHPHIESAIMTYEYEKVLTPSSGLRLHLNENTAGCSPQVIDALQRLTRQDLGVLSGLRRGRRAAAARLGVEPDTLVLTNGLDEGILAVTVAALRERDADRSGSGRRRPGVRHVCSTRVGAAARGSSKSRSDLISRFRPTGFSPPSGRGRGCCS